MTEHFDAVVIGAGPAGSAVAILLARAGWSVALVERQRFPRRKVCGECVAASNLPLLDALGIGDAFSRTAGPALTRVALWHGDDAFEADLPRADDAAHPWGRALGRERLDTMLVEAARAAGVDVRQPCAAQRIDSTGAGHEVVVEALGEGRRETVTVQAGVVVAAHGSWEPLPVERDALRLARGPGDLFAFKANFVGTVVPDGLLPVLSFDGGYGGMVVADDGIATLACCVREDRLAEVRDAQRGERAGEAVEAMLRSQCRCVARALEGASRHGPWLATGPIRPGIRLGTVGPADGLASALPVFRVGNAAGEAHPIVGEGISMALQSAFVLASVIGDDRPAMLGADAAQRQRSASTRYEALWRRRFATRLRVAAAFAHTAMRPTLATALGAALRRWPALLTHGAAWSGKTRAAPEARRWLGARASARRA